METSVIAIPPAQSGDAVCGRLRAICTIHYLCPPGATDDILHALVYALEVSSYYMRRWMAFGV